MRCISIGHWYKSPVFSLPKNIYHRLDLDFEDNRVDQYIKL